MMSTPDDDGWAAHRRCCRKTADDTHHVNSDRRHHTMVHSSPLQPARLFSTSNTNTNNIIMDSKHITLSMNTNDADTTTTGLILPQLSIKEEADLGKLIMFQLNISRSRRRLENEEDAENLVTYALDLIKNGESVAMVVEEVSSCY
jgi:hypothetical protein